MLNHNGVRAIFTSGLNQPDMKVVKLMIGPVTVATILALLL